MFFLFNNHISFYSIVSSYIDTHVLVHLSLSYNFPATIIILISPSKEVMTPQKYYSYNLINLLPLALLSSSCLSCPSLSGSRPPRIKYKYILCLVYVPPTLYIYLTFTTQMRSKIISVSLLLATKINSNQLHIIGTLFSYPPFSRPLQYSSTVYSPNYH